MSEEVRNVIITVPKPDAEKFGAPVKIQRMRVVYRFVSRLTGIKTFEDDNVFQMVAPDEQCDVKWFRENVFRFVDIDNVGNDRVADERVDKLVEMYKQKDPEEQNKASIALIAYFAQDMYMKLSIWRYGDGQ